MLKMFKAYERNQTLEPIWEDQVYDAKANTGGGGLDPMIFCRGDTSRPFYKIATLEK